MKDLNCDILVVGSGVAALSFALSISNRDVILITKKELKDSNSYLAQGGICVRRGSNDRESFIEDTMRAGHFKNKLEAVKVLVDESEEAIDFLIKGKVPFTKVDGKYAYTREGGHSKNRIMYADDATGRHIMESLIESLKNKDNVRIFTNTSMEDLLISDNRAYGVYAKNSSEKFLIKANYTILATGGIGGIYKNTTNFSHIRGDGVYLASKHNVKLKDMSYIQIHPTSLYEKKFGRRFLISESVRGEGAVLLNHKKERFTDELKPRDIVSAAIFSEMEKENVDYEFLNMCTIKEDIEVRFPNICSYLKDININPKEEDVPIVPSQHYTMGGIEVDLNGRTSTKNLYAIGEAACTGVHGANRLASNSLLESVVYGRRAAKDILTRNEKFYNIDFSYKDMASFDEIKREIKNRILEDEHEKTK